MKKLIIKNGLVFDPLNQIEGEVKDILIEGGKIVENFTSTNDVKEIDANNKTVIPGAIDINTHITSPKLNWVRLLGNNIKTFNNVWNTLSIYNIAKKYIKNGYTFICESNVLPSLAKQALFDFDNLPVLDSSFLLNVSNLWVLESEFQRNNIKSASAFLSDLLLKTKALGLDAYNPFESESWNFNTLRDNIKVEGKLYDFTPLDVYKTLTQVNEFLNLPHSIHTHVEGYESEVGQENLKVVLNVIKSLNLGRNNSGESERNQIFHLAHANSYNIDGDNSELIEFYNTNSNFGLDVSILGFDKINPLITSDRRLFLKLKNNQNFDYQFINSAVEFEGDSFVTFRNFDKQNSLDLNLWANAIELLLGIKNKWQIQLSLNYPNYSDVDNIPHFASLLLSQKARRKEIESFKSDFNHKLTNNDSLLTFNEFIIVTRASPAKSLGLSKIKGNLGINADADINILDINISDIDINDDYDKIKDAFTNIEYVLKRGEIVKNRDKYNLNLKGNTFYSEGSMEAEEKAQSLKKKKEFYQKYYSVFYDSFNSKLREGFLKKI